MEEQSKYRFSDKRFWTIAIMLLFIFLVFMGILVWKAEALTKNPCSICAKQMGEAVTCTVGGMNGQILTKSFYVNGSTSLSGG